MAHRPDLHTSKFLSYVLRHRPDSIGITLDENGWVDVEVLLAAAERHGKRFSRQLLEQVVAENDKKRFAFSEDGRRIRASQGRRLFPEQPDAASTLRISARIVVFRHQIVRLN